MNDLRRLIADVAKRVVEDRLELPTALRQVAQELGIRLKPGQPDAATMRAAIQDYRELFRPEQAKQLHENRRMAIEAMRQFDAFQPRLIGSLVNGDGPVDVIRLLLTADTPEQVIMHLSDQRTPWRETEARMHYSGGRIEALPALRFQAGDSNVELIIMPPQQRSDPPRDPIGGGKLAALSQDELAALVERTASH